MNDKKPSTEEQAVRVSVSEAARLFGIHPRTIRRAIQDQELRYVVVHNRYKILFSSLVSWSQKKSAVRNKRDKVGIGQWVDQWKIKNTLYSPRAPRAQLGSADRGMEAQLPGIKKNDGT